MKNIMAVWEQLYHNILQQLAGGGLALGEKLPSEVQLIERYNVSRNTVRKALKALSDQRIIETRHGSGYYIISLPKHDSHSARKISFGAILTDRGYFSKTIEGMEKECEKNGYNLKILFAPSQKSEVDSLKELIAEKMDAYIISPLREKRVSESNCVEYLQKTGMPFVMLGKPPVKVFCNAVYCDDMMPSALAVEKLYEAKCRKIMHIYDINLDTVAINERLNGFISGARQYFGENNLRLFDLSETGCWEKIEKTLAEAEDKIGIFLHADAYFNRVNKIVESLGLKYGKDVSVIGFGNDRNKEERQKDLTTFEIPKFLMGEEIIKRAALVVGNGEPADRSRTEHTVFQPIFIGGHTV